MKQILTFLALLATVVSQAQLAGAVDTTFAPNNDGVPFSTSGYYRAVGVEVIDNSVYYAYACITGYPAIRKYDFQGNEDQEWYTNQMTTWGAQFATNSLEPEKDSDGNYTGKFFICGRNSSNSMVSQGVRFLNKINADGTRDLNFVCPITSWISICSAVYHDWENNKLYYSYQSGYSQSNYFQTIVCCDPNTGQILQTFVVPGVNGLVKKITKIPNTNDLIVGGDLNFTYNGNQYNGLFKLTEQFIIAPIEGVTNLSSNFVVADILFVNNTECDGTSTGMKVYVAGGGNIMAGVSGLRSLARFSLTNDIWAIDINYNAGCSGSISDIVYYNCHLIATGNFASSMPTGPYAPTWTPKVTAFTSDGQISPEFKMQNIGYGLGGVYVSGFENNLGQGSGHCLAVNPSQDDNDRWEIFIGGGFVSLIQGPSNPRNVIKPVNYMAKLYGFGLNINSRFTYCLDELDENMYSIITTPLATTSGCEKWELYESSSPISGWNLIETSTSHNFTTDDLVTGMWYKLIRTVTECGNTCSSSYILYKDPQNCQIQNISVDLRISPSNNLTTTVNQSEYNPIEILISPNPTLGLVTIKDKLGDTFRNISLYNSTGIKVLNTSSSNETYQMDLTYLPSGVYMIVVTTDKEVKKQQIIKE